ncbi:MAG: hypothetical protein AzoDbin1_01065 [Azoarcus sp.]|nr:hypothetical protein [Azoarcus sp.]
MKTLDVKFFSEKPRRAFRLRSYADGDRALLFGDFIPANGRMPNGDARKMQLAMLVHRSGAVRAYYLPASVPLTVVWNDDEIAELILQPAYAPALSRKPGFDAGWFGAIEAPLLPMVAQAGKETHADEVSE